MSEYEHNHDDLVVPTLPKPTTRTSFCSTTLVMNMSNKAGLDGPIHQFDKEFPNQPIRETGVTVITVVMVDPTTGIPLGSETIDVPHSIPEMEGGTVSDFPDEVWAAVSKMVVQTTLESAHMTASLNMIRSIIGNDATNAQVDEWMIANIPKAKGDDMEGTGTGLLLKMYHAHTKGETIFQSSDYGATVAHVTGTDTEWAKYVAWLSERDAATADDLIVQMDNLPAYVETVFGVTP